jgi:hypothetical protein
MKSRYAEALTPRGREVLELLREQARELMAHCEPRPE